MKLLKDMNAKELSEFYRKYFYAGNIFAKEMFPHRTKGHRKLCKDLACWAINMATYYDFQDEMYRKIAESIFKELPADAKAYISKEEETND